MKYSTLVPWVLVYLAIVATVAKSQKIVLTNDDGWAVAMIREQESTLTAAGYDVILSCPAENESGTGSSSAPPTTLTVPCEFDTCPAGSPPEGFDASDPRINYVNSFPVDAVRFGIQTLSPQFFDSLPDFVVSGPNVGNNLASLGGSGTIGAACEAALEGIPSTAFSASGSSVSQVSFTTLSDTTLEDTRAAIVYASLTTTFVNALLVAPPPILPRGISINVNYPPTTDCSSPDDFSFILTRVSPDASATDVETCGTNHLPGEASVIATTGCFASVSVFNASTKGDVDAATQGFVLQRLGEFLSCLPS